MNQTVPNAIPFGVTPSIGGFNSTTPSQLPWQTWNAIQSSIYGGNVSSPWLGNINPLNPLASQLPAWLNSFVNQGVGCSPFGTSVHPWVSPNVGSPTTTPYGNYLPQNMNAFGGISPWQSLGSSFSQPIGFGSSNCVTPFGCCL
jgi:hypothetical protein